MSDKKAFRLLRVKAGEPSEWARIVALDAACFGRHDAPALSDNAGAWWVAFAGKMPAGYCGVKKSSTGANYGYLCRAGVLPDYRGNGLQKQMIRRRIAYARAQEWTMLVTDTHDNVSSANSLIACGFSLYNPPVKWAFSTSLYWRKFL
jgi:GNAT superfamily N-acetyltransferase